jgi:hypothetical protein
VLLDGCFALFCSDRGVSVHGAWGLRDVTLKNREVVACLEPHGQSDVDFDNGCNDRFYFLFFFFIQLAVLCTS